MTRILFVGARNLWQPTGEWRLVSSRAAALGTGFGIETDAEVLVSERHLRAPNRAPQTPHLNVNVVPFGGVLDLPRAFAELTRRVRTHVRSGQYCAYILSGIPTNALTFLLPPRQTLIDIHGVLEEWLENPPTRLGSVPVRHLLFQMAHRLEHTSVRRSAGALVVTNELGQYAQSRYGARRIFVVPCTGDHLSVSDPEMARQTWRQKLDLGEDLTFVYSGGTSPHQLLPAVMECYRLYRSRLNRPTRLVIFTQDRDQVIDLASSAGITPPELVVHTLPADEVVRALHACDVGLMLRADNWTNRVAFPNKFAEYVSAGLITIASPGLREPAQILTENGIGLVVEPARLRADVEKSIGPLLELLRVRAADWTGFRQRCLGALEGISMDRAVEAVGRFVVDEARLRQ